MRSPDASSRLEPGLVLRAARRTDLPAIAEAEAGIYVIEGPWGLDEYQEDFATGGRCYRVVTERGRLVGYGFAALEDGRVVINGVTALVGHRRRGIGQALLDELVAWARRQGVAVIVLQVREENHGAIVLYERNGFEVTDRLEDFYDDGVHALEMVLPVG